MEINIEGDESDLDTIFLKTVALHAVNLPALPQQLPSIEIWYFVSFWLFKSDKGAALSPHC